MSVISRSSLSCATTCTLGLLLVGGSSGCQTHYGSIPGDHDLYSDLYYDVQYFPPGPDFKLAKEAAAMKEAANEAVNEGR